MKVAAFLISETEKNDDEKHPEFRKTGGEMAE